IQFMVPGCVPAVLQPVKLPLNQVFRFGIEEPIVDPGFPGSRVGAYPTGEELVPREPFPRPVAVMDSSTDQLADREPRPSTALLDETVVAFVKVDLAPDAQGSPPECRWCTNTHPYYAPYCWPPD